MAAETPLAVSMPPANLFPEYNELDDEPLMDLFFTARNRLRRLVKKLAHPNGRSDDQLRFFVQEFEDMESTVEILKREVSRRAEDAMARYDPEAERQLMMAMGRCPDCHHAAPPADAPWCEGCRFEEEKLERQIREQEEEVAAAYAEEDKRWEEEERERQVWIAQGLCPDCHRKESKDRWGHCLHCKDDAEEAEERAYEEEIKHERRVEYNLWLQDGGWKELARQRVMG